MKTPMKLRTPRNPLVTLARRRHAGSHRPNAGALRQRAARALLRELDTMKPFAP